MCVITNMKKKQMRWVAWFETPKMYPTKKEMLNDIKNQIVMYGKIR